MQNQTNNQQKKGGGDAAKQAVGPNSASVSALRNQAKKSPPTADIQGDKKKGNVQPAKHEKVPEQAPDAEAGSQSDENAGQASSAAGGQASSEVAGYGLGYSDFAYYNVLKKGGRVTRHTIRKEEEPTGGNGTGSQSYIQMARQKQDEQAKMLQQQRDIKRQQRRQQSQRSQASSNPKQAVSGSLQIQKEELPPNQRPKIQPRIAKKAPLPPGSKSKVENALGAPSVQKDEASNAGDQTPKHPSNAIADSAGSSGESKQALSKPAVASKKSTLRYERREIGDPISLKMQSMELQGRTPADAIMADESRPSPPKMSKHQSLVVSGSAGGEKGAQQQDRLTVAGHNQRSTGRQSISKGHPMQNSELLAGHDATTPIEHTEYRNFEQQPAQASSNAAKNIKKRDDKAGAKQAKRGGQHGQQPGRNEDDGSAHTQGHNAHALLAELAKARQDAKNQVNINLKEHIKKNEQKQQQNQPSQTPNAANSKASYTNKRTTTALTGEPQPSSKRGLVPASPTHQDKLDPANPRNPSGQEKSYLGSAAGAAEGSSDVKERDGGPAPTGQLSGKKGKPAAVTTSAGLKKGGGASDSKPEQPDAGGQPNAASAQLRATKSRQGAAVADGSASRQGLAASREELTGANKQSAQQSPPGGTRHQRRPQNAAAIGQQVSKSKELPQMFSKQDEQMLFDVEMKTELAGDHLKNEKIPNEPTANSRSLSSPNAQFPRKTGEGAGGASAASAKMQAQDLKHQIGSRSRTSAHQSPQKTDQAQQQASPEPDAARDQDAEMPVLQLDFRTSAPQAQVGAQPRRPEKKRHSIEKYLLDRHLEMKDKFEQHFPHYQFVDNRLVLYGEGCAQIESVSAPTSSSRGGQSRQVQGISIGPVDYEKIVAQVKIYTDHPSIPMPIKVLKYLGKVYTCDIKFLCPAASAEDEDGELPGEMIENLDDDYQARQGKNQVLLVQVIDDTNRYHANNAKSPSQVAQTDKMDAQPLVEEGASSLPDAGLKYSTHHPMRFYFIGKDEFDDRLIMQPVAFKSLLSEREAAELMILQDRERDIEGQPPQQVETNSKRIKELQMKFDYLRDLQLFEDDALQSHGATDGGSHDSHWAYKADVVPFVKAEALKVVRKFNEYKDKMSKVVVTEQNMYNSLFTLCLFDNNENQRSKGVLMQIKYDRHKKNYLLQFRHIQMKQDQKEKFEWVALTTAQLSDHCKNSQLQLLQPASTGATAPSRYYHVMSEYFRGFVSLDYLKCLDNTYETGTRLRSKLLQLISHEASILQVHKQLNVTVFPFKEQVAGHERDRESQSMLAPPDEDSKMSSHAKSNQISSLPGRSEETVHAVLPRKESAVKHSHLLQQANSNLTCKRCNYQREGVGILKCSECHDAWHVQCLEEQEYQQHLGVAEKQWRCPNCIRCTNCRSMMGNKKLMLVCRTCNSPYHFDCLDQSVKLTMPQIVNDQNQKWRKELRSKGGSGAQRQHSETKELSKFEYQCQNCIQCAGCGAMEAGPSRQSKWSRDFNFCSPCNRKRRALQYCKICLENWPSIDPNQQPGQEELLKANMIKCFSCSLWIHVKCDLILLNDSVQKQLIQSQRQSSFSKAIEPRLQYCCPDCREQKRMEYVKQIVTDIQAEDKNGFFTHEFWEEYDAPTKQSYLRQIKYPMCFDMIFKRLEANYYIYDALQLRNDLQQMFWNAKDFNRPNQLVYKDASKLHSLCLSKISSHYPYLQRQTFAQEKEDLYRKLIHSSPDFQKRFLRILYPTAAQRQDLEKERERLLAFQERELPRFVVGEGEDENHLIQDATNAIEAAQADDGDNNEPRLAYLSCFIEEEHLPKGMAVNVGAGGAADHVAASLAIRDSSLSNLTNNNSIFESAPAKQGGGGAALDTLRKNLSGKEGQHADALSVNNAGTGKAGGANALTAQQQPEEQLPRQSTRNRNTTRVHYNERNSSLGLPFQHAMRNNSAVLLQKLNPQEGKPTLLEKSAPSEVVLPSRGNDPAQDDLSSPALLKHPSNLHKRPAGALGGDDLDEVPEADRQPTKKPKIEDDRQRLEESITKIIESQQQSAKNELRENRSSMKGVETLSNKAPSRGGGRTDRHEGYSASGTTSIFNPNNYPNKEKSRKLMMERYQKEDDEGCYYCNPIHCSFDDPQLIFEEMCYLCGSFGNQEDFVTCILCGESFHTYCLQLQSGDVLGMYQSNWKCLNCKSCECCGKATDEDLLMFCGVCDRPYHSFCLTPVIKHLPQAWKCEHCFKCKQCGTREYYNEEDVRNGVNLQNDDYQLSKNFTLCHQCGQNEYKKQSCSICMEKTTPEMNRRCETLKCRDCGFYSHIACSRVSAEELYLLLLEHNEQHPDQPPMKSIESVYKCLDCIIKGKQVNFLILESCLHYENIHCLILRQQFISDICIEILCNYFPEQFRMKAPKFIQKFITQNQEFFRYDDAIVKWIELMETEVSYEGAVAPPSSDEKDGKASLGAPEKAEDVLMTDETKQQRDQGQDEQSTGLAPKVEAGKPIKLLKGHWKRYNPFEPSRFMLPDDKSKNLFKDFEVQLLNAATSTAIQTRHMQLSTGLEHKYDYQKLICGVKGGKATPAMKIENSMTCFKRSMLPEKRSMYESLYKQTLNRYSLSGLPGPSTARDGSSAGQAVPMVVDQDQLIQENQEMVGQSQGIQGQQGQKLYMDQDEIQRVLYPTQEKKDKLISRLVDGLDDEDELSSEYDSEIGSQDGLKMGREPVDALLEDGELQPGQPRTGREHEAGDEENSRQLSLVEMYVQYELKAVMRIKLQFFKWFEEFFAKTMNVFLGHSSSQNQNASERPTQIVQNQIQDDSSVDSSGDDDCSDSKSLDSMVMCSEDTPVDNPQRLLTCLLCKLKGEFTVTGRLIPYKLNMYVHTSCALWTDEVFDIDDGQIINFYQQQKKLQGQKCAICGEYGATLSCSRSKGCNKHYHFPCAYRSGRVRFNRHKEIFCESCLKSRGSTAQTLPPGNTSHGVGGSAALLGSRGGASAPIGGAGASGASPALADEQNAGARIMFPSEYLKKKRLYIVQNTEEINQQEYENEMENQMISDEKQQKARGDKDRSENHKGGGGGKGDKGSKKDKNDAAGSSSNQNNNQGGQKEIDLDKWRPFYFDLFNRVGNLTVLSLRKEVNQLIDIVQKDNSASGINNIQAYIQQQQLLYAEQQISNSQNTSRQKEFESPARKSARPGAPGVVSYNQSGTPGSLMEDLRKYLDLFNDYATIRIYWKFYEDRRMQQPAHGRSDPRKLKRAYYLFINKTKQIIELERNDLRIVLDYCAQQIGNNFIVQGNVNAYLREMPNAQIPKQMSAADFIEQDAFWSRIMDHFRGQRANFSLQNIEFCVEKLFGLAKYPINVWNQLELTNHDLKYNLNTQKSRLSFFLKSAISVFHATTANATGYSHPYNLSGAANSANGAAAGGPKDKTGNVLDPKTLLNGRVLSMDGVFQRMIKVNNMDKYEYDIVNSHFYKKQHQQHHQGQQLPQSSRFAYRPAGQADRERQWAPTAAQGPSGASAGLSGSSSVAHGAMGPGHVSSGGVAGLAPSHKSGGGTLLGAGGQIEHHINQMDQLSVNNLSSKHMTMNQLLIAMGRGHKVDIGKISKILESQKNSKQNRKVQQSRGLLDQDIESLERSELRARKRVLESKQHLQQINQMSQAQQQMAEMSATQLNSQNVNKVNKINLPLAMQYRSSLQLPPKVEVGPSKIHRIGLFTLEDLKPLDIVIEYVGEIIRHEVADLREKRYIEKGIGDCYMFTIDDQHIIDATFFGGKARYLNHSCDANCSAKIITVDNQKHIIIRAKKHISAGSELTYNYNFDQEEDQMSCLCGAKNCQGYLA